MNAATIFDVLAQNYDADFTTSIIGQLQRKRVRFFLTAVLNRMNRPLKILEINCGTGEDAIWLASLGHNVTATDASAVMIDKAKKKLLQSAIEPEVAFLQCPFHELATELGNEKFDLVFSNFGGLNCIDKNALKTLSNDLSNLIKENGELFFVIMAKYCAWEIGYYSMKAQFKTAFRRIKKQSDFVIDETVMPVYYYSPGRVRKIFSQQFNYSNKKPVGLFIPPSYLESHFKTREKQLQQLNRWEEKCCPAMLADFADHYCISFTKTANKK
jgi:ubiquinone/menaquinone biosynthesis C-methylase UbiE